MNCSLYSREFRWIAILTLSLLISSPSLANTTYDFLRIDPSPRGAALAGNSIALLAGDLNAITIHPAGLAFLDDQRASVSYANHPLDVSGGQLSYGFPTDYGYAAFALNYLSYGSFDRRQNLDDEVNGTFTPTDILLVGGFGRQVVEDVGVGVSLKFIRSEIDTYSSTAIAADISAHWDTRFRMIQLAAGISNLGTQLESYGDTAEDLPTEAHIGFAKYLEHLPLELSLTAHYGLDQQFWGALAGEFMVSELLMLRAGYTTLGPDYHVGGSQDAIAGVSAGIGISYMDLKLDYALYSQGALGEVHRLGVTYLF